MFVKVVPKYLNSSSLAKDLLINLHIVTSSCILISIHENVLSFISVNEYRMNYSNVRVLHTNKAYIFHLRIQSEQLFNFLCSPSENKNIALTYFETHLSSP